MSRNPPPDHLIPFGWLEKAGVTSEEIDKWTAAGIITRVDVHGGASFCHFPSLKRPVKFREIAALIQQARQQ